MHWNLCLEWWHAVCCYVVWKGSLGRLTRKADTVKTTRKTPLKTDATGWSNQPRAARVSFRSVFDVERGRLAIGHFNRPLDDAECRSLRHAWERARMPEVEDFEVTAKQVSFLTPEQRVDETWRSIDALLAAPKLAKAS